MTGASPERLRRPGPLKIGPDEAVGEGQVSRWKHHHTLDSLKIRSMTGLLFYMQCICIALFIHMDIWYNFIYSKNRSFI
jgi:hypothetical protein